jgi:hypothetical protein
MASDRQDKEPTMRALLLVLLLAVWVAAPGPAPAQSNNAFEFVAIGDMPYRLPGDYERFANLIAAINRTPARFTVHVGDIKSGSSECSDAHFQRIREMFDSFERPLVFTPGDNEWTDCHRANNGSFDPIERLGKLRTLFFPDGRSLGKSAMPLEQQSREPRHAKFVENARWSVNGVVFATLHVVGSNNNLQRDRAALEEYLERNAACVAWLKRTFEEARAGGARGVVVFMQANPWFERGPDDRTGFEDTVKTLEEEALAFGRPVVLVHGDTHYFRVDQPLKSTRGRKTIETFTRVEVFGDDSVHGVRILVDPDDPALFAVRPLIVPANLIKH